tara:strand:+ start:2216 stop:2782 length:567 start_codon:yes stop_codon:yes gene_type:complete
MKLYKLTIEYIAYVVAADEYEASLEVQEITDCEDHPDFSVDVVKQSEPILQGWESGSDLYGKGELTLCDVWPKTIIENQSIISGKNQGFSFSSQTIEIDMKGEPVIMAMTMDHMKSLDVKTFFKSIGSYQVKKFYAIQDFYDALGISFKNIPGPYDEMMTRYSCYLLAVPHYDPMDDPDQGKLFGDAQ